MKANQQMSYAPPSQLARYSISVVSVGTALFLSLLFRSIFEENPFLLFWGATAVSSWYGGIGPGLLTTVLSILAVNVFFIQPVLTLQMDTISVIRLIIFAALSVLIGSLYERNRKTEDRLRAARGQLEAILTGITDGITAQKPNGELIFANDAAAQLTGYPTREALLTASIGDIMKRFNVYDEAGNPFPLGKLPNRLALQGQRDQQTVVRFRSVETNEDRWSIVKATPIFDENGHVQMSINLFQDITDLKRTQETLYEQREHLRVMLNSIGDGVIATDERGIVRLMNPVAETLTGWTAGNAEGHSIHDVFPIIHEKTLQPVENSVDAVLETGQVVHLSNHTALARKDGSLIPIEDSGAPIRSTSGAITGAVLVFHDVTERRKVENTLRENYETLQAVINASPLPIVVYDIEGNVKLWSPAAERVFGWKATEAIERFMPTVTPEHREALRQSIELVKRGQIIVGQEATRRRKDGSFIEISFSGAPLHNANGEVTSIITIAENITERKRNETAQQVLAEAGKILASSLDYQTTLKNVAGLATPTIADWCAIDVLDEHEQVQRLAVAHIDPDKVQWAYEIQKRYPSNPNSPRGFYFVLRTGETDYYPHITDEILTAAARDPEHLELMREIGFRSVIIAPMSVQGHTFGAITFVTTHESGRLLDQSDLQLAEELARRAAMAVENARLYQEAQTQRERFKVTLASIGDAVIATDTQGKITFMNAIAEALTGWAEEDASGLPLETVFRIVNEDTRRTVESPVTKVLREGGIVGLANHTLLIAKNGDEIPIDDSGAPIMSDQGKLRGVVLVFRDITERKHIERQRAELLRQEQAARQTAEEANELKLKFLAMISHELRTPLTSIKGFTSTLLAEDVTWDADTQREFIKIMDDEADKLTDLVEQLLDVSRLTAGTLSIRPRQQHIQTVLDIAMAQLQTLTANHQLLLNIPAQLPSVMVDSQRIAQVLVNLVDNAAKYSPPHSRITVAVKHTNDHVRIDVSDEGEGIPLEERLMIFEAFRQAERRDSRPRGAGLGLAICKGVVEAHGGQIWVDSQPLPGTTISFTLPVSQ